MLTIINIKFMGNHIKLMHTLQHRVLKTTLINIMSILMSQNWHDIKISLQLTDLIDRVNNEFLFFIKNI